MKAVLINVDPEQKQAIDKLMAMFCSAVRYSFGRILDGKKIGEIEKDVLLSKRKRKKLMKKWCKI
ncbi:MAG: hypothetical protein APF77_00215 [Clostridia bacterium BRH_c25]|nr:MAG: hypothetical protein APF77_00215 [Clostridia bacterium BRH_c25]